MKTKKSGDRLGALRQAFGGVEDLLGRARERLGLAVVDEDRSKADELRAQVAELEAQRSELMSAIPVAERRAAEEQERQARALRRQQAEQANAQRRARLDAARGVDDALRQLGEAYARLEATSPGSAEVLLGQRARFSLRAAAHHWAAPLCRRLGLESVPAQHWLPLAQSEATTIPQQEIEPS